MQPQHVPAWKRLGLRLKYAKDPLDTIPASTSTKTAGTRGHGRVLMAETGSASPNATKRRRTMSSTATPNIDGTDSTVLSPSLKRTSNSGLRKKVSFTAETKQLDGDSSKSLIAAWEIANSFSEDLMIAQSQLADTVESVKPKPNLKPHDEVKKTRQKREDVRSTPRKSTDALDYLFQFHQDRKAWKFNKNREVWILKHVLSLDDIPASYDSALSEYVQGLKSRAAKSWLADQCSKVAAEDIGKAPYTDKPIEKIDGNNTQSMTVVEHNMHDPDRRKAHHDAAEERFKRKFADGRDEQVAKADEAELLEYQKRAQRKSRAELLLRNMSHTEEVTDGAKMANGVHPDRANLANGRIANESARRVTNGAAKTAKRSRKIRTNAVVSDSSSDDGSDSDDEESLRRISQVSTSLTAPATQTLDNSTSTSGSDTSSDDEQTSPTDSAGSSDAGSSSRTPRTTSGQGVLCHRKVTYIN